MNNFGEELSYDEQLDIWGDLIAKYRWSPDLFIEAITPINEDGIKSGITLGADQKILMRVLARFPSTYIVLPRGYGKTTLELLSLYVTAILTPDLTMAMGAQSQQSSASLFMDKHADICRFFPIIEAEIIDALISKDKVRIVFKSGAVITNMQIGAGSKGLRRNLLCCEEAAIVLESADSYFDNCEPLISEPYKSIKDFKPDPYIMNKECFVTTAYYKNDSHMFNLQILDKMTNLQGGFVFGGSYHLPAGFKRGRSVEEVEALEEKVGSVFFNTNYRSRWITNNGSCIVDIGKLQNLQVIPKPELKPQKDAEYYISVDVARSTKNSNNETAIGILKIKRDKREKIKHIQLVNMIKLPNGANFQTQSLHIKRLQAHYNATTVVVDINGLILAPLCRNAHRKLF